MDHSEGGSSPTMRGLGYGREIAQFCIDRAADADMTVIEGECAPPTSLPFWQAMGFRQVPSRHGSYPWVWRAVSKTHVLPAGQPIAVVIRTFHERAVYASGEAPISEHTPMSVRADDDLIHFGERVILDEPALPAGDDLVVEIEIAGQRLAFDKAKRAKLAAIGVRHDRFRQYFIDCIDPAGDAED